MRNFDYSVENSIKQLVDKGLLIRHGTGRSTFLYKK